MTSHFSNHKFCNQGERDARRTFHSVFETITHRKSFASLSKSQIKLFRKINDNINYELKPNSTREQCESVQRLLLQTAYYRRANLQRCIAELQEELLDDATPNTQRRMLANRLSVLKSEEDIESIVDNQAKRAIGTFYPKSTLLHDISSLNRQILSQLSTLALVTLMHFTIATIRIIKFANFCHFMQGTNGTSATRRQFEWLAIIQQLHGACAL